MPKCTVSTLAVIRGRCQDRCGDTTTRIWSTTADGGGWSNAINDALVDIYQDIAYYNALALCDNRHAATTITMVADTEDYDYVTAINNDSSKKYYAFVKAMWGDYRVRVLPWFRYHQLLSRGELCPSALKPFMVFWGAKYFKLRPKPAGNDATHPFIFYYLQPLTVLDADGEFPDLDERIIPLLYAKVEEKYWRRRHRYELMSIAGREYDKLKKTIIKRHAISKISSIMSMDAE